MLDNNSNSLIFNFYNFSCIDNLLYIVNKLSMPEYSDAYKEREKFVEKFKQFEEYNNSILKKVVDANNSQLNVVAENK